MIRFDLTYKPFGETAILIEWPERIDPDIIQDINSFDQVLRKYQKVKETIVAYNSILVKLSSYQNYSLHYKHKNDFDRFTDHFRKLYGQERDIKLSRRKLWEIPVCYDLEFGIDLEELSQAKNISVSKIVELHTEPDYLIYFLGFQPGFMYLGGLNELLHTPRRVNPRLRISKGAVGIGGQQTGIYPQDSSGGWNIIGNSPLDFFNPTKKNPCFFCAGESVRFTSIDIQEYHKILNRLSDGTYQPKFSWL